MFRIIVVGITLLLATVSRAQQEPWIDVLRSDATVAAKAAACRELKVSGTAESVPALASLLTDVRLSHEARIALESIPGDQAAAALRDAVGKTAGVLRAGVLDSIGERRDVEAVAVIAAALADDDPQVVASAALALGKIGSIEAVRQLEQAYENAVQPRRTTIGDGLLAGAIRLQQAGHNAEANAVFRRLSSSSEPAAIRSAALSRWILAAGGKMPETLRSSLVDNDPLVRAAAATALPYASSSAMKRLVADLEQLPAASQVLVLTSIRLRGDRELADTALVAARSADPAVAVAGIKAIAVLADIQALEVLLPLATGKGPLTERAWRALEILRGTDVDARLTEVLRAEQSPQHQVRLIRVLVARNAASSVPVLLVSARNEDDQIRAAAIDAIFRLATPEHVPAIVRRMLQTARGGQRDTLEKAVMLALDGIPDKDQRTAAVLEGVDLTSEPQRIQLLPLLGRIGGHRALELVQIALQHDDAEIYEAGVRAITNWPDASVVEQLADLAQNARENHQRLWALRAMIRVSALPGSMPEDRKLALLERAMDMATRDDERSLALQRSGAIRTVDSLQFAASYLDHPSLAIDASRAVVELAHHKELRDSNREPFADALRKVLATTTDTGLKDRAAGYLQQLGP